MQESPVQELGDEERVDECQSQKKSRYQRMRGGARRHKKAGPFVIRSSGHFPCQSIALQRAYSFGMIWLARSTRGARAG